MTDQSHIPYGLENGQFSYTDLDNTRIIVKYSFTIQRFILFSLNLMSRLRLFSISRGQSYCRDLRLMISSSRQFLITDLKFCMRPVNSGLCMPQALEFKRTISDSHTIAIDSKILSLEPLLFVLIQLPISIRN